MRRVEVLITLDRLGNIGIQSDYLFPNDVFKWLTPGPGVENHLSYQSNRTIFKYCDEVGQTVLLKTRCLTFIYPKRRRVNLSFYRFLTSWLDANSESRQRKSCWNLINSCSVDNNTGRVQNRLLRGWRGFDQKTKVSNAVFSGTGWVMSFFKETPLFRKEALLGQIQSSIKERLLLGCSSPISITVIFQFYNHPFCKKKELSSPSFIRTFFHYHPHRLLSCFKHVSFVQTAS